MYRPTASSRPGLSATLPTPRMRAIVVPSLPLVVEVRPGVRVTRSDTDRTLLASSLASVSTVTTTGTSCSRSERFWAVTTSSLTALESAAAASPGKVWAWANAPPAAIVKASPEAQPNTYFFCNMDFLVSSVPDGRPPGRDHPVRASVSDHAPGAPAPDVRVLQLDPGLRRFIPGPGARLGIAACGRDGPGLARGGGGGPAGISRRAGASQLLRLAIRICRAPPSIAQTADPRRPDRWSSHGRLSVRLVGAPAQRAALALLARWPPPPGQNAVQPSRPPRQAHGSTRDLPHVGPCRERAAPLPPPGATRGAEPVLPASRVFFPPGRFQETSTPWARFPSRMFWRSPPSSPCCLAGAGESPV